MNSLLFHVNSAKFLLTNLKVILANSENVDEMPHKAAFHQGLHCLLGQIDLQRKSII